jgi:putative ABC transport system permease protein
MVRLSGDPLAAIPALKTSVSARAPGVRLDGISTMDAIVSRTFAPWRFSSVVVTAFAMMALAFAGVGISSLVAFAVTQRTREIGVRVALGARPLDVVVLVAREGVRVVAVGAASGVLAAWLLRRAVQSMLFGVSPGDAWTFCGVALVLGAVSLVAAYVPARRAARLDPVAALRAE